MKNNFLKKIFLGLASILLVFLLGAWSLRNPALASNHCESNQAGNFCWYHLIIVADPVDLCIEGKFVIGAEPDGYIEGFCPEDPGSTEEPRETPSPEPTSTPLSCSGDQHLDASGTKCVSFELGGPPAPSSSGGGEVLGATTLAATGSAEENLITTLFVLGAISLGLGTMKHASQKGKK